ncbi:hypothetical protein WJX73_002579 [Symbiochloris irregularis]|uniref:RRM domain-containing protein n=1 Tax=Symbiochloris irregularis TaxID=706552 RepID=A0AAW1P5L7_9CHLO
MAGSAPQNQVAADVSAATWWLLDGAGQHVGPYTAAEVAGHVASEQVAKDAHTWAEGRPEWQPISAVPELQALLGADAANGIAGEYEIMSRKDVSKSSSVAAAPAVAVASASAAPSSAAGAVQDAELAAFQAELADIDPEAAAALDPVGDGPGARISTPPPEDQRFEDDDGTVYVWDRSLRKFVEEPEAASLPEYNAEEMTFVPEEEKIPAMPPPAQADAEGDEAAAPDTIAAAPGDSSRDESSSAQQQGPGKKKGRAVSAADVIAKHAERGKRAREGGDTGEGFGLRVNTSVYVTGLPDDVTEEQLAQVFSKCGVIKPGDDAKPRVKVYRDKALGNVAKGDGLVIYLKAPSVDLACRILDGAQLRPGQGSAMTVQPAKFELHGGEYQPRKKAAGAAKRQKKANAQAEEKLLGWGGFDDQQKPTEVTVILLHMFDPQEMQGQADEQKELEADVKAECERIGPVQKVRVFTYNPNGAMSVRFKTPDAATACVQKMQGRFFGGRQLEAFMWDGVTNYQVKKSKPGPPSGEDEATRLEAFAAEIEQS